ncbi:MAG: BMP family ABC transporter substrate-binding protein [Clostridiaceae bacterium]|nr:BMP family ABC transporter substrate-binding protein [Clostridiaceae bacterium]
MKKFTKILAILLALVFVFSFAACGKKDAADNGETTTAPAGNAGNIDYSNIKFGLICLHDENSTYDNNFISALKEVQKELGLSDDQVLIKTNIPETDACLNAAEELIDEGCNIIFADSFGHETYILQAAQENPDVQFCHATGTHAHNANVPNFHNAFASIYEGRYLAGVAAGLKIKEMIDAGDITADQAKLGYVGAFPYAEVKSGYTSFFLGVRSIVETATMEVVYTNSWFDIALEREAALKLINDGCVLISQHADSEGAPKACEEKNVPNVAYNINTASIAPNTALVSSRINWAPYYKLVIDAVAKGESFDADWTGTIATGSVELLELNAAVAAEGTQAKLDEVKAQFEAGTLHVYDTDTFTVKGEKLDTYLADVDDDGTFTGETEAVSDGYFHESEYRSAPYFDLLIDGITEV